MRSILAVLVLSVQVFSARHAAAQTVAPPTEATRIAAGRALLAQGNTAGAAALGRTLLAQYPMSTAVLAFAVDADIARAGMLAGLGTYETWVIASRREDAHALHQIARASLREVGSAQGVAARVTALQALVADGDADAAAALAAPALAQEAGSGLLAAAGNDRAITALIGELQDPYGNRKRAIVALGASRSRRAVNPLIALLNDRNMDIRAAAAEALGKLGSPQAIMPLKGLLDDPAFPVHYQAAAALFALDDMSGLPWLRQLESHEEAGIRLTAVQATSRRPDASWMSLVRSLTTASDPGIRRQAAGLLAPHDPEAAKAVLTPLLAHPNLAEQELATAVYLQTAETDLPTLRQYLRTGTPEARLQAAIRILELTR